MNKWHTASAICRRRFSSPSDIPRLYQCTAANLQWFSTTSKRSEADGPPVTSGRSLRRDQAARDIQRALQSSTEARSQGESSSSTPSLIRYELRDVKGDNEFPTRSTFQSSMPVRTQPPSRGLPGQSRFSGPPGRSGNQRSGGPRGTGGRSDRRGGSRNENPRRRGGRGPREEEEGGDDPEIEAIYAAAEAKYEPQPQPVPYTPKGYTKDDLKDVWPAMALGRQSTVEGLEGKLSFLANRRALDHVEPEELAKRLQKGELVEFKDEEEKEKVLKVAEKYASDRAGRLSERKGENVDAVPMEIGGFEMEEKKEAVRTLVRGEYKLKGVAVGGGSLAGEVMRNLVNNGTYRGKDTEHFMKKFQGLVAAPRRTTAQVVRRG